MVSYMWGADVADALRGHFDREGFYPIKSGKIYPTGMLAKIRVIPLKPTIVFKPVDKSQSTD